MLAKNASIIGFELLLKLDFVMLNWDLVSFHFWIFCVKKMMVVKDLENAFNTYFTMKGEKLSVLVRSPCLD